MALWSSRVAYTRLCFSICLSSTLSNTIPGIATMTMGHNLGVVANHGGGVVDLLGCFLAVGGDDVLALLNVGSVYNNIVFFMTLLTAGLLWSLIALPVLLVCALGS